MTSTQAIITVALAITSCQAFTTSSSGSSTSPQTAPRLSLIHTSTTTTTTTLNAAVGNMHGENSCFMPLLQNDEGYVAPRTVQIAGFYPGVDTETYLALTSEPSPEMGQWTYDFSDPDGPQMGTVALPGMTSVYETEDPVAIIADHVEFNVQLPPTITDRVDLVVLCDRARTHFSERKFLVMELEESPGVITIGAFESKGQMPENTKILGQVTLVQIPWLPSMQKKTSGFAEEDQLY
mmetsp:Transcript_22586/g.47113  ORF Transcript_22586/g.47113 Transcript_22586/m.47113 type:complete len:237 (+) Transcript_22586:229-939(+)